MDDRANILREMKVCRFCLSSDQAELANIYDKHTTDNKLSVPLPLQIMACIAIEVFKNDGMPQLICNSCRNLTIQAYTFKSNCKKAEDAFKVFLATGQLSKPYLHRVKEMNVTPQPAKSIQICRSESNDQPHRPKRIKMEDGTEIITLNITGGSSGGDMSADESSVHQGQHENETILGFDDVEDSQEATALAADADDEEDNVEEDRTVNPVLKVNQVKTDCFSCPHCDRSFPLKQLLDLHVPNHKRQRRYQCDDCERAFFSKYDLQKHLQTHSGNKPFNCVVCQKTFSRESLLRRHEKIHNDAPKYMCSQCDRTFLTNQYLDAHMDKHKKKRPYTCQVCNKSFVFKQGLERHEVVHSQNKPHNCNYCEASFTSAIKLTRHITSHAGLRPYPCKWCGRTFLLSHHLTRHMRSHYAAQSSSADTSMGQHKCDICSMSFRRKDSLINHSAIHSMVNLRCVICNTTFDSAKMVKEHITTHLTGLPFPCEKCDYSFETSEQLEEHELKHAEMEYEEQIEKEVYSEARLQLGEGGTDDECEDGEVTEYTITDINNPEVVPRAKQTEAAGFGQFLKDELGSDLEGEHDARPKTDQRSEQQQQHQQEEEQDEVLEPIKPIVRQEGTKVYSRKAPAGRKMPSRAPQVQGQAKMAPLEQITQSDNNDLGLSAETINALPPKKYVNMKLGEKMVRVQKFIVTKEEMKAMAKQGILEMKGGQVVLKNPGQPVMNATLKPMQKIDMESLLEKKSIARQQIKKYQRRSGPERPVDEENTGFDRRQNAAMNLDDSFEVNQ